MWHQTFQEDLEKIYIGVYSWLASVVETWLSSWTSQHCGTFPLWNHKATTELCIIITYCGQVWPCGENVVPSDERVLWSSTFWVGNLWYYVAKSDNLTTKRHRMYKVVQIWPGLMSPDLHTISPRHIWTTLYKVGAAAACCHSTKLI